jgi:hypothetical protein
MQFPFPHSLMFHISCHSAFKERKNIRLRVQIMDLLIVYFYATWIFWIARPWSELIQSVIIAEVRQAGFYSVEPHNVFNQKTRVRNPIYKTATYFWLFFMFRWNTSILERKIHFICSCSQFVRKARKAGCVTISIEITCPGEGFVYIGFKLT